MAAGGGELVVVAEDQESHWNWMTTLPVGVRFTPKDDELIDHYLKRKVNNLPIEKNVILEANIYDYNPEELAAMYPPPLGEHWYFYTPRARRYPKGVRPNRSAGSGYWKATGKDIDIKKEIIDSDGTMTKVVIGFKKTLVFCVGRHPKVVKTDWIMHEFILSRPRTNLRDTDGTMKLDEWVLCRMHQRVKNSGEDESAGSELVEVDQQTRPITISMEGNNLSDENNFDTSEVNYQLIGPPPESFVQPNLRSTDQNQIMATYSQQEQQLPLSDVGKMMNTVQNEYFSSYGYPSGQPDFGPRIDNPAATSSSQQPLPCANVGAMNTVKSEDYNSYSGFETTNYFNGPTELCYASEQPEYFVRPTKFPRIGNRAPTSSPQHQLPSTDDGAMEIVKSEGYNLYSGETTFNGPTEYYPFGQPEDLVPTNFELRRDDPYGTSSDQQH